MSAASGSAGSGPAGGGRPADERWWQSLFSLDEAAAYGAQRGNRQAIGERPAVLVVDVVRAFTGERGQSLAESVATWPTSCGPSAWQAVPSLRRLVDLATTRGWPLVFTTAQTGAAASFGGTVKGENDVLVSLMDRPGAQEIPPELGPPPGALVLAKPKASAFFGTALLAYLLRRRVDSLLVAGTTTSGCVRATVVDGHSWGLPVFVVEEACFDRARLSHGVSLYEMDAKYADVITLAEVEGVVPGAAEAAGGRMAGLSAP